MSDSIRVSEKHGVNPSLDMCIFCDEPKGIALLGRLPDDAEAPRHVVTSYEPCDKCQEQMSKGITLIGITHERQGKYPPIGKDDKGVDIWPIGSWMVVSEELVRGMVADSTLAEDIIKKRTTFVASNVLDFIKNQINGGDDNT